MENMVHSTCLAVFCLFVASVAAQGCDSKQLNLCGELMTGDVTVSNRCDKYNEAKKCLEALAPTCSSDSGYQSTQQGVEMFGSGCDGGAGGVSSCIIESQQCVELLNENGGNISDPSKMCVNFKPFKACWDPLAEKCKDDQMFMEQKSNFEGMLVMCQSNCDLTQLQDCIKDFQKVEMSALMTVKQLNTGCQAINNFQQCFAPIYESCKTVIVQQPENAKMIHQQRDMIDKMKKLICEDNLPKLAEFVSCIDNDTVQSGFMKCEKMYGSPKMDDQGKPMAETEVEQCQRMGDMNECLTTAVSSCGKKATEIFVNMNQEFMKIKVAGENFDCPTDAATGLAGHMWMIVFTVAMTAFFY